MGSVAKIFKEKLVANHLAKFSRDDISDPFGKSQIFYNFCIQEIKKFVEALFEVIKEQLS